MFCTPLINTGQPTLYLFLISGGSIHEANCAMCLELPQLSILVNWWSRRGTTHVRGHCRPVSEESEARMNVWCMWLHCTGAVFPSSPAALCLPSVSPPTGAKQRAAGDERNSGLVCSVCMLTFLDEWLLASWCTSGTWWWWWWWWGGGGGGIALLIAEIATHLNWGPRAWDLDAWEYASIGGYRH